MTIAIIVVVCIILAILAFLLPRLSHGPQRGVDKTLSVGQRAGGSAPGWEFSIARRVPHSR